MVQWHVAELCAAGDRRRLSVMQAPGVTELRLGQRIASGLLCIALLEGFLALRNQVAYTAASLFGQPVRLYIVVTQSGSMTVVCHLTALPQEDHRDAHPSCPSR